MAKLKDTRNWQEEYKKLKVNFDRLDRMNDVLYRYWFVTHKIEENGETNVEECIRASGDVLAFMEELENEYKRRRSTEAQEQKR